MSEQEPGMLVNIPQGMFTAPPNEKELVAKIGSADAK